MKMNFRSGFLVTTTATTTTTTATTTAATTATTVGTATTTTRWPAATGVTVANAHLPRTHSRPFSRVGK